MPSDLTFGATRGPSPDPSQRPPALPRKRRRTLVDLPGGTYAAGDSFGEGYQGDGEGPVHQVALPAFRLDATSVTNEEFARFVKATGHVTTAEREGFSAVFHLAFDGSPRDILGRSPEAPWWLGVRGASWRTPEGAGSNVGRRGNHPVVHVSYDDALAYCAWAGTRLPTEAEWEYAARGGRAGSRFPWGDDLEQDGTHHANVWQGDFPDTNTADDGFVTTAPVRAYDPNGFGLHQMIGNVWEWCADWFSPTYYADLVSGSDGAADRPADDPRGPAEGLTRVMRGGSYLCHESYCHRYRLSARSSSPTDSTAGNLGFRCAADQPAG